MLAVTASAQGPITTTELAAAVVGVLALWIILLLVLRDRR